jgi:hypothetical protein
VGSALLRRLRAAEYERLLFRTRAELVVADSARVLEDFLQERPEFVIVAAVMPSMIHSLLCCHSGTSGDQGSGWSIGRKRGRGVVGHGRAASACRTRVERIAFT